MREARLAAADAADDVEAAKSAVATCEAALAEWKDALGYSLSRAAHSRRERAPKRYGAQVNVGRPS